MPRAFPIKFNIFFASDHQYGWVIDTLRWKHCQNSGHESFVVHWSSKHFLIYFCRNGKAYFLEAKWGLLIFFFGNLKTFCRKYSSDFLGYINENDLGQVPNPVMTRSFWLGQCLCFQLWQWEGFKIRPLETLTALTLSPLSIPSNRKKLYG